MMNITTHVLDTSAGKPAAAMAVYLYFLEEGDWIEIARALTNKDGRIGSFELNDDELVPGIYKLRFETKAYFNNYSVASFYPMVEIVFDAPASEHYHVPLLLNPFGYSTYRGS